MKNYYLVFLAFFWTARLFAQVNSVSIEEKAQDFFERNYYNESLEVLNNYEKSNSLTDRGKILKSLSLYQLNRLELAEEVLRGLINDQNKAPYSEVWLFLARINHHNHKFEEAVKYYKIYLRTLLKESDTKESIIEEIRRCANGRKEKYRISGNFVENLGSNVNSSEEEYFPVESGKTATELYFSAMSGKNTGGKREETGKINEWEGSYYADMYRTSSSKGKWNSPNTLHFLLNSPQHEILVGFNEENQNIYFYRGNSLIGGQIMVTDYSISNDLGQKSRPFFTNKFLNVVEGGIQVYNETLVIFSARILGGYGGLDLYYSVFNKGEWSDPINLGPKVNSPFDEAFPHLSSDGKTLFYSSNSSDISIGGFDIVKQLYDEEKAEWEVPLSMGMPINSAGDDIQFYLAKDGFTGYFASNRKTGFGKRDLFVTYLSSPLKGAEQLSPKFLKVPPVEIANVTPVEMPLEDTTSTVTADRIIVEKDVTVIDNKVEKKLIETDLRKDTQQVSIVKVTKEAPVKIEKKKELVKKELKTKDDYIELPIVFRIVDRTTASYLNEIQSALPTRYKGYIYLIFTVRNSVPLYDKFRQVEQSANQVFQFLMGLGIPSERIAYRITTNPSIQAEKIRLRYEWRDNLGLPLDHSNFKTKDPFAISQVESPFYYKVSLSGASDLKNAALINNYPHPTLRVDSEGRISYSAGKFKTYEGARLFAKELIANGLTELKIAPHVYDVEVSDTAVSQFVHLYPDFYLYLNQKP